MSLSLPQEKLVKIVTQCQDLLNREFVTLRELTSLIGRLTSSAIAVLPAPLQYRTIQRQQIWELNSGKDFESLISLNKEVRQEINWWIQKLESQQRKVSDTQLSTDSDFLGCLNARLGCLLPGSKDRGSLECLREEQSHKLSGAKSSKTCDFDIYQGFSIDESHSSTDGQYGCISVPKKDGGHKKSESDNSKQGNLGDPYAQWDHNYC